MAKCPICDQKIGFMLKAKVSDGIICTTCARICASHATKSISEIQAYWNLNRERLDAFSKTHTFKSFGSGVVVIDDVNRLISFGDIRRGSVESLVYKYDEIDGYECEVGGKTTIIKRRGGTTGTIIEDMVGKEIVPAGGTTVVRVHLATSSGKIQEIVTPPPSEIIPFLDECLAVPKNVAQSKEHTGISVADEILKFKNLLDVGIITQEEFETKKKELLGL